MSDAEDTDKGFLRKHGIWRLCAALLTVGSLAGCASQARTSSDGLISQREEAKIGAAAHPEIVAQFGGSYRDPQLSSHLKDIVGHLAKTTGGSASDYRLTVLDTPTINAFAAPGGYLYVTRGLLALANDESEVAGVLAHELGHLDARHGAKRQVAAQRVSLLGNLSDSLHQTDRLELLSSRRVAAYSRGQELEADKLGMAKAAKARYDPNGAVSFLTNLQRRFRLDAEITGTEPLAAGGGMFSSHPGTGERIAAARSFGLNFIEGGLGYVRNRDAYLNLIDGLAYGENPRHGVVRGRTYFQPALKVRFTVPKGFEIANLKDIVLVRGPDEAAVIVDGAEVDEETVLKRHLVYEWGEGLDLKNLRSFTVNGLQAVSAETMHKGVGHELVAVRIAPRAVYRFLFITRPVVTARYEKKFAAMVASFRKLTHAELDGLRPLRIRVVEVKQGDTVKRLAERMAIGDRQVERFRVLNGLDTDAKLVPGQRVKIVSN